MRCVSKSAHEDWERKRAQASIERGGDNESTTHGGDRVEAEEGNGAAGSRQVRNSCPGPTRRTTFKQERTQRMSVLEPQQKPQPQLESALRLAGQVHAKKA